MKVNQLGVDVLSARPGKAMMEENVSHEKLGPRKKMVNHGSATFLQPSKVMLDLQTII
jgi:hypothetical protein